MPYQLKREPWLAEAVTCMAPACQSVREKLVTWTLLVISFLLPPYMISLCYALISRKNNFIQTTISHRRQSKPSMVGVYRLWRRC